MKDDNEFERKLQKILHSSEAEIDPAIVERLDRARENAVQQVGSSRKWLPYAAVATVALSAIIVFQLLISEPPIESELAISESDDLELLLVEENLDMFEEMEFYQWLSVTGDES